MRRLCEKIVNKGDGSDLLRRQVGPGNCLGMLAAKSSPSAIRGIFCKSSPRRSFPNPDIEHPSLFVDGTAAAAGKIGAFAGTWAFPAIIADFPAGPKQGERAVSTNFVFSSLRVADIFVEQDTGPFWIGSGLAVFSAIVVFFCA